jgi:hypothetical protein
MMMNLTKVVTAWADASGGDILRQKMRGGAQ